jgi:hypothetical protein
LFLGNKTVFTVKIQASAYSPVSVECNHKILTPFCQHQLNTAKKEDWENMYDWQNWITENRNWKIRAFNHELSSEKITIERLLGIIVQRFGILWKALEYQINKIPTIFCVLCKLLNICMDCWLLNNPIDAWHAVSHPLKL